MKDYLTAFTVESAKLQKSLDAQPTKPTRGYLDSRTIIEKPPDGEPSKPIEAAFVGFEGKGGGHFSNLVRISPRASSLGEEQSKPPYLTENNELIIPLFAPERYHWWQGGQSVWATLAELGAPLATWRRHCVNRGEFLFSAKHVEWCGGDVQTGDDFAFCVECGGYAEGQ